MQEKIVINVYHYIQVKIVKICYKNMQEKIVKNCYIIIYMPYDLK